MDIHPSFDRKLTPDQLRELKRMMLVLRSKYARVHPYPMDTQGGYVHLSAVDMDENGNIQVEVRFGVQNEWEDWEEFSIEYISKEDLEN